MFDVRIKGINKLINLPIYSPYLYPRVAHVRYASPHMLATVCYAMHDVYMHISHVPKPYNTLAFCSVHADVTCSPSLFHKTMIFFQLLKFFKSVGFRGFCCCFYPQKQIVKCLAVELCLDKMRLDYSLFNTLFHHFYKLFFMYIFKLK